MRFANVSLAVMGAAAVVGCGQADDSRGVARGETLLSVSASGKATSRPDRAEFEAGIQTFASSARAASQANREKIAEIVGALRNMEVAQDDIQTRAVTVQRVEWGDRKGQFQASNIIAVTLSNPERASDAVTAVTEAGANIVSGPNLSMTDPEATANLAYADAYKAARRRAEAYAKAAGMKVSRVLYIRDAGGQQGGTWLRGAEVMDGAMVEQATAAPPPPPASPIMRTQSSAPGVMIGTTRSDVYIQVDFALTET